MYVTGDPVPEEDEEPERQNHNDWAWLPLFAALTTLAYLWTPKQDPIPEISFPFFLQHMLYTGEVRTCITCCWILAPFAWFRHT